MYARGNDLYSVLPIPFYLGFGFLYSWRSRYFSPEMKKLSDYFFALIFALAFLRPARALGHNATISFNDAPGRLELATRYTSVQLILNAADWPGVLRVVDDLAVDLSRVTCVNGSVPITNDIYFTVQCLDDLQCHSQAEFGCPRSQSKAKRRYNHCWNIREIRSHEWIDKARQDRCGRHQGTMGSFQKSNC